MYDVIEKEGMKTNIVKKINNEKIINDLFDKIEKIIVNNKIKMTYQINNTLVDTYFNIEKEIVENEQNGNIRAEYGKEILLKLSKKLTGKYGSGYSGTRLQNMRLFYNKYKNCQPLAGKLSWSHYCYLIYIEDDAKNTILENVIGIMDN